ncbi:MAG: hypothetical protein ACLQFR_13445 [Streptosporangiaceae bacterium]
MSGFVLLGTMALVAGCGPAASPSARPGASLTPSVNSSPVGTPLASATPRPTWPVVLPVPAVAPGLHQTHARPPAHSPVLRAEMTDLWAGVVTGKPALAMPAFFPVFAYKQVKAISDPAADWRNRLVYDFRLDVHAAHQFLGRAARHARLIRVVVPEFDARWVPPGVCYNSIGYWHVGGARIVYKVRGQDRSIGIASLISWRGRWYVVHFGAVLRAVVAGMVDQPSLGEGVPGPAGGC